MIRLAMRVPPACIESARGANQTQASKPGSWGETNDRAMFQLVSAASQPNLDGDDDEGDAYFLTGEEAAARVECTKQPVRNPIITSDQQQFRWRPNNGRPIEQFFQWIG